MTDWIIIGVVLLLIAGSMVYLRKRKQAGKSGCGCDCSGCDSASVCGPGEEK